MKLATLLLSAGALCAFGGAATLADEVELSFAVEDITIANYVPEIMVTVRNLSTSIDPANRNLQTVSANPAIHLTGTLICKDLNASNLATGAEIVVGDTYLTQTQAGRVPERMGIWAEEPPGAVFNNGTRVGHYDLDLEVDMDDSFDRHALIHLGFHPVKFVEERLQQYVANGAGSEADFLRVDDVFETTIPVSAIGYCLYHSEGMQGLYAGIRTIDLKLRIFYQGDPDIEDMVYTGMPGTVQAAPSRARGTLGAARGGEASPPARSTPAPAAPARSRPQPRPH